MAFTLSTLQTAFYRRGFDFMSPTGDPSGAGATAATQFLNQAAQEIDAMYPWPYLLTSTTGTAPLTVADLRKVQAVQDTTNGSYPLEPSQVQNLSNDYGDLTTVASPLFFYFTGQTTIATFPVSTDTLKVSYWKFAADMAAASDAPAMPDRFRPTIVDYAAAAAFRESNVPDEAGLALQEGQRKLALMVNELLDPQDFGWQRVRMTAARNY